MKILRFLALPITTGFLIALVVIQWGLPAFTQTAESNHNSAANNSSQAGLVSYADAVEKAAPAVVNIQTVKQVTAPTNDLFNDPYFRQYFGRSPNQPQAENSLGSGVIIDHRGYILTNNHVIAEATEISVMLQDGRSSQATIVGTDPETDLAVLHIPLTELPAVPLNPELTHRIGDVVLAIGNPFGIGQTVTQGIVSATGRNKIGLTTFEDFIQTDAAINVGNSGGALIDAYGNMVGINTAIFTRSGGSQGIGFAIPVELADKVMRDILEYGYVVRGWLGIEVQEITPALAQSFGYENINGVLISGVYRNSPAHTAGLESGDILVSINGEHFKDAHAAMSIITETRPESTLNFGYYRNGEELTTTAEIGYRPAPE